MLWLALMFGVGSIDDGDGDGGVDGVVIVIGVGGVVCVIAVVWW